MHRSSTSTRRTVAVLLSALVVLSTFGAVTPVAATAPSSAGNVAFTGGTGYSSVSAAISAAGSGDTVKVSGGTHGGLTITKKIDLEPVAGATPVFKSDGAAVIQIEGSADGTTVHGMTLQGTTSGKPTLGFEVRANHVTLTGNTVTAAAKTGIQVQDDADGSGAATGTTISGNHITANLVGVSINGGDTVTGNDIHGVSQEGIGLAGANNHVSGNTFVGLGDTASVRLYGDPASANGASGEVAIANQLLADNTGADSVAVHGTDRTYTGAIVSGDTTYGSIQQAVDSVSAGATVTITKSGTYGGFRLSTPKVTVTNASGVDAEIDPSIHAGRSNYVVYVTGADGATVHGLHIDATGYTNGISVSSSDVTVSNNVVTGDSTTTGIQTHTGTSGAIITHNHVTGANVGISLMGTQQTAKNNVVTGAQAEGIGLIDNGHSLTGNTIATASDGAPAISVYGGVPAKLNGKTTETAQANALLAANDAATVAYKQSGDTYDHSVSIGDTYYPSVRAAIAAAKTGDTVHLAAGTYTFSKALYVDQPGVTIEGAGQGKTTLDFTQSPSWGLYVPANHVHLTGFSVKGPETGASGNYGVKVGDGNDRIDVAIDHVTVTGSHKSEFDLNGVGSGTTLSHVTANGAGTAGAGIALTNAKGVTIDHATTTNNGWGGVAIMTGSGYTLSAETSDITLGDGNDFGEPVPVYVDPAGNGIENGVSNLDLGPYTTKVTATGVRDGDFSWYFADQQTALTYAASLGDSSNAVVQDTQTGNYLVAPGVSIDAAVNAASPGDTISLTKGTFTQSVDVSKDVTITGAGQNDTVIASPESVGNTLDTGGKNAKHPVVYAHDANVDISDLTVDGAHQGDSNYKFVGIGYANANGTVSDVTVTNVMNSQFSGAQHGVAMEAYSDGSDAHTVTLKDSILTNYQKTGFVAAGDKLTANVQNTHVVGQGTTDVTAQNGIEYVSNAGGSVDGSTVVGNDYHGTKWSASGILVYGTTAPVSVTNNRIVGVRGDAKAVGTAGLALYQAPKVSISGNTFENQPWQFTDYSGNTDASTVVKQNSFDAAAGIVSSDGTPGSTVYGYLQQAVNDAQSGDTVVAQGTFTPTDPVTVDTSGVTVSGGKHKATISTDGDAVHITAENVQVSGFVIENGGQGVRVEDSGAHAKIVGNTIKSADAGGIYARAPVSIVDNTLTQSVAQDKFSGGNYGVRLGEGAGNSLVASNTFSGNVNGLLLASTSDVTVDSNTFTNNYGVYGSGNDAVTYGNGLKVVAKSSDVSNVSAYGNTFSGNGNGLSALEIWTSGGQTHLSMHAQRNDFTGNVHHAIQNHRQTASSTRDFANGGTYDTSVGGSVDATLNWFGQKSGPTAGQIAGPVTYDPFLTTPSSKTPQNVEQTQQFGHDLTIPGDGKFHSVAFPAGTKRTFGQVFGDFQGTIWAYDSANGQWVQPKADQQINALDAVVVRSDSPVDIHFDFRDASGSHPYTPQSTQLHTGWNFVGAPMTGSADTAFAASSADPQRVLQAYASAGSIPDGAGDQFGQYALGSSGAPRVSAYTGYWVYVGQNGTLAANGHPGMTASTERNTLYGDQYGPLTAGGVS